MNYRSKEILEFIKLKALELGIDSVGVGSVSDYLELQKKYYTFEKNPADYFAEAKSVLSCALSLRYDWNLEESGKPGFIARYTTANFYRMLSGKMKQLSIEIKKLINSPLPQNQFYQIFVNSKLNDKLAAVSTGNGSISRNSCVSIQNRGPCFVLGTILLPIDLLNTEATSSTCGNCSLCVQACPTQAINSQKEVNRSRCLQHLTTESNIPDRSKSFNFIKLWGDRFYGCSVCTDVCPNNQNNLKHGADDRIGFIGTFFDCEKILSMNKADYKIVFRQNQLSSGWVREVVLARNGLISLYNQKKFNSIIEYKKNIENYGWQEEELFFLKNFIKNVINN